MAGRKARGETVEIKDELAARRGSAPTQRAPESPDKTRWMLWLAHDTLAALAAESERLGTTRAQIVRDVLGARMALSNDQISAYIEEAAVRGVTLEQVFTEVLAAGTPRPPKRPNLATVPAA